MEILSIPKNLIGKSKCWVKTTANISQDLGFFEFYSVFAIGFIY